MQGATFTLPFLPILSLNWINALTLPLSASQSHPSAPSPVWSEATPEFHGRRLHLHFGSLYLHQSFAQGKSQNESLCLIFICGIDLPDPSTFYAMRSFLFMVFYSVTFKASIFPGVLDWSLMHISCLMKCLFQFECSLTWL